MDFQIKVEPARSTNIFRDESGARVEHAVSVTHNGWQWQTFQLTTPELRKLRDAIAEYIYEIETKKNIDIQLKGQ